MAADIQAIEQAYCTECETDRGDSHSVLTRLFTDKGIYRHVKCDCDAESVVRVSEEGLSHGGAISYEKASWNQERK